MRNSTVILPDNQPLLPLLPTFWLHFSMRGDGVEWQDEGLPTPNYLEHAAHGEYYIAWQIAGFFVTKKSRDYLNDMIARVLITFSAYAPQRIAHKPPIYRSAAHYYPKIYRLRELQNLRSLPIPHSKIPARADGFADYTFWSIKLWAEDEIRRCGEGVPIPYRDMEDWSISQFPDHRKGVSTIKAKCRSVWNWYDNHDWELPKNRRKHEMTRQERAKKNAAMREEKTHKKIVNIITGLYADELKKKNGTWNISRIANELGMHRDTVAKHLRKIEQENWEEIPW